MLKLRALRDLRILRVTTGIPGVAELTQAGFVEVKRKVDNGKFDICLSDLGAGLAHLYLDQRHANATS